MPSRARSAFNDASGGVRCSRQAVDPPSSERTSLSPVSSSNKTLPARSIDAARRASPGPSRGSWNIRSKATAVTPAAVSRSTSCACSSRGQVSSSVVWPKACADSREMPMTTTSAGGATAPRAENSAPRPSASSSMSVTGNRLARRPIKANVRPSPTALPGTRERMDGASLSWHVVADLTHHGTRLIVSSTYISAARWLRGRFTTAAAERLRQQ